ncbi:MAG TPA: TrkA C-terminal domain-containing protein [Polyangiaceae bacterium]|nr:TrkA C-terminal domain-containing protein [Polyangiaceae bacterium]
MTAVIALLVIATISLLVVRVGTTALMMTGISWDTASFQAYSAFFGVGFTTKEAEMVVNHPVRRRIIRDLILAGNVGLTSALATMVVTLLKSTSDEHTLLLFASLVAGAGLLFFFFRLSWFQRLLDSVIRHTLQRAGLVRALDYELLLRIQHGYAVSEVEILPNTSLADRSLRDSRLRDKGVIILAIKRNEVTLDGLPGPNDTLQPGDVVTVYGKEEALHALTLPSATTA